MWSSDFSKHLTENGVLIMDHSCLNTLKDKIGTKLVNHESEFFLQKRKP